MAFKISNRKSGFIYEYKLGKHSFVNNKELEEANKLFQMEDGPSVTIKNPSRAAVRQMQIDAANNVYTAAEKAIRMCVKLPDGAFVNAENKPLMLDEFITEAHTDIILDLFAEIMNPVDFDPNS